MKWNRANCLLLHKKRRFLVFARAKRVFYLKTCFKALVFLKGLVKYSKKWLTGPGSFEQATLSLFQGSSNDCSLPLTSKHTHKARIFSKPRNENPNIRRKLLKKSHLFCLGRGL